MVAIDNMRAHICVYTHVRLSRVFIYVGRPMHYVCSYISVFLCGMYASVYIPFVCLYVSIHTYMYGYIGMYMNCVLRFLLPTAF
jgi:hypothetical protein